MSGQGVPVAKRRSFRLSSYMQTSFQPMMYSPQYFITPPPGGLVAFSPTVVHFPPTMMQMYQSPSFTTYPSVSLPFSQPFSSCPLPIPTIYRPTPFTVEQATLTEMPSSPPPKSYRFPPLPEPISDFNKLDGMEEEVDQFALAPSLSPPSVLTPRRASHSKPSTSPLRPMAYILPPRTQKGVHACKMCDQTFTRAHDLKRHNTIHSVDKAYPCPMPHCSKKFGRKDALKRHLEVRGLDHDDKSKKVSAGVPRAPRAAKEKKGALLPRMTFPVVNGQEGGFGDGAVSALLPSLPERSFSGQSHTSAITTASSLSLASSAATALSATDKQPFSAEHLSSPDAHIDYDELIGETPLGSFDLEDKTL